MDAKDVKKLRALLSELYPRQRQEDTRERLAAWTLALEPFDYEAVRAAALAHARKSGYYPSVSELTAGLAQPEERAPRRGAGLAWQRYIDAHGLS